MSKICPLFSGSTGNSTYIGTKYGAILVDAGASMRGIKSGIESISGDIDEVKAIVVTHQHNDHIKGLKTLLSKTKADLIASKETLESLCSLGVVPAGINIKCIDSKMPISVNDTNITRFATSHDCEGSSGYTFTLPDGKKVAICTDLGIVTDEVRSAIVGSDLVLLESNHDVEMLKKGPYPPRLKMRILSDKGHISNNMCAAELPNLIKSGTTRFILGHLSLHNNTPNNALSCAKAALIDVGAQIDKDYLLTIAKPYENGVTVI